MNFIAFKQRKNENDISRVYIYVIILDIRANSQLCLKILWIPRQGVSLYTHTTAIII